jgi:hypothetical protein
MRFRHLVLGGVAFLGVCWAAADLPAQQATIRTPFNMSNSSFFEQNSIAWSGRWGGATFQFGNPALANPQFGGFQAGAGLSTNFAILNGNFSANFALSFGQGARNSIVSQTPSVTLMNGQTGYMSDTSQTPFVISVVPVVGGRAPMLVNMPVMGAGFVSGAFPMAGVVDDGSWAMGGNPRVQEALAQFGARQQAEDDGQNAIPAPPQPGLMQPAVPAAGNRPAAAQAAAGPAARLLAAQESSAGRAAPSVAEARRLHDQEKAAADGDLKALMIRARTAEEDGKPGVAKIYYRMVVKRASGDLKAQAQERLDALGGGPAR